jgi:LmbE family N-acetylglucosaminyl deacetylase
VVYDRPHTQAVLILGKRIIDEDGERKGMEGVAENVVLTLMAHPDDAEFLCGGALALLARRGWRVHVATATPGDCGSSMLGPEAIAAVRRQEARSAAAILGGEFYCLERRDLEVRYDPDTLLAACGLLRSVRPHLVITHSPGDYMVDHEQISLVARAAAFNAPIPNAPAPPGYPAHTGGNQPGALGALPLETIPHLYYADPVEGKDNLGNPVFPGLLINISATLETKLEMLACHDSQREWLRNHHGIDEYLDSARRWSRERGALAGCAYAEGFRQHRGHAYPQDDLLALSLPEHAVPCSRLPSGKPR